MRGEAGTQQMTTAARPARNEAIKRDRPRCPATQPVVRKFSFHRASGRSRLQMSLIPPQSAPSKFNLDLSGPQYSAIRQTAQQSSSSYSEDELNRFSTQLVLLFSHLCKIVNGADGAQSLIHKSNLTLHLCQLNWISKPARKKISSTLFILNYFYVILD